MDKDNAVIKEYGNFRIITISNRLISAFVVSDGEVIVRLEDNYLDIRIDYLKCNYNEQTWNSYMDALALIYTTTIDKIPESLSPSYFDNIPKNVCKTWNWIMDRIKDFNVICESEESFYDCLVNDCQKLELDCYGNADGSWIRIITK